LVLRRRHPLLGDRHLDRYTRANVAPPRPPVARHQRPGRVPGDRAQQSLAAGAVASTGDRRRGAAGGHRRLAVASANRYDEKTDLLEVPPGFEPGNEGFADPCLTTWPRHRVRP